MSEHTSNRTRSLEDSIIDISKLSIAIESVEALRKELHGIDEAMGDADSLMDRLHAVEDRLKENKKASAKHRKNFR